VALSLTQRVNKYHDKGQSKKKTVPQYNVCATTVEVSRVRKTWHPEHFVCSVCKMELCTTGFFEREGRPYCAKDYHDEFAPRCAYCKGPILQVGQNILTALDQTWHPEHFFCSHCGDLFGPEGASLVPIALPLSTGNSVWRLWRAYHWALHFCPVPQVSPRALCVCLLPAPAQPGNL
uniref:LIM zinc-binding domain-containing protein n=1 Tax=Periophthalmus magnuspinnatus TaxID=409849 RepID=A0A3B4AR36_9GOBI